MTNIEINGITLNLCEPKMETSICPLKVQQVCYPGDAWFLDYVQSSSWHFLRIMILGFKMAPWSVQSLKHYRQTSKNGLIQTPWTLPQQSWHWPWSWSPRTWQIQRAPGIQAGCHAKQPWDRRRWKQQPYGCSTCRSCKRIWKNRVLMGWAWSGQQKLSGSNTHSTHTCH